MVGVALSVAITVVLSLSGCGSAVKSVAHSFNQVQADADFIDLKAAEIERIANADPCPSTPAILADAAAIRGAVADAKQAAVGGLEANTQTTDKVSPWVPLLKWGFISVATIAVLVTLWQTGAIGFIRGWLGLVSPKTRTSAKLMAEAIADEDPANPTVGLKEHVAVLRTDPAYDVQYQKAAQVVADKSSTDVPEA